MSNKIVQMESSTGPFYFRDGTTDRAHIPTMSMYKSMPLEGAVVLDLGYNIGTFSRYAMMKGASVCYGLEPEPENYAIGKMNAIPGIELVNVAVVDDAFEDDHVDLYVNEIGKNKGSHTLYPTRGRRAISVRVMKIGAVFAVAMFTVMKVDIEGEEYKIFPFVKIPDTIVSIAMKYHYKKKEVVALGQARSIDTNFKRQGFRRTNDIDLDNGCWGNLGLYRR